MSFTFTCSKSTIKNENTRTWYEIYSKSMIQTPKVLLIYLLLILNEYHNFSSVFIVEFQKVNARLLM